MTNLRAPGEPGRYMPAMDHICGLDGGDNESPICGKRAEFHLFAGDPVTGASDWTMFACLEHFEQAKQLAWDYHEVSAVCDIPGTIWQARAVQGQGFCYWPESESAIREAVSEMTLEAKV